MQEQISDKELLTYPDEGASFSALYNRYWELLYDKALNKLGGDADAQDAVQEVFISLWRNRNTIKIEDSVEPYLFTALKYCIIKKLHREARRKSKLSASVESLAKSELNAAELVQYKELQTIIESEVEGLPDRMKEIYRLSRIEYLSVLEIAEQLQLSEQTVKNTLTTALKKLREGLSRYNNWMLFLLN